jgi:uncharacterized protein involved in exopolysaccharide biosynthesis
MNAEPHVNHQPTEPNEDEGMTLLDLAVLLAKRRWLLLVGSLGAGLVAFGLTYLVPPTFTARTSILPPQQQQSAAASALASLGALSGLASAAANIKSPADQYVALLESETVADHIIDQFGLMKVYGARFRFEARSTLASHVRIAVGKKDGLISVDVDDQDPKRAADIANRYVEELRLLTGKLALTEAQQRRMFFESQLAQTRDRLARAQQALQASGFSEGALKAEPKAAAESYATLRGELTAAEVQLQILRKTLTDGAPEVQQQLAKLAGLRGKLAEVEATSPKTSGADYVGKYREFKYQETLFDLLARQYEAARVDESREGALIQVVDPAKPPEWKSRPKRAMTAIVSTLGALCALIAYVVFTDMWQRAKRQPRVARKLAELHAAPAKQQ